MIGIYKIENLLNHKVYIGQSTNIERRWRRHCTSIDKKECYDYPLYRAFRKYGIENFSFSILQECDIEELDELEIYWIEQYNSYKDGYNQTKGGDNGSGPIKLSEEQILEIYKRLKTDETMTAIGESYGVSYRTISSINDGSIWFHKNIEYPIRPTQPRSWQYYCQDCGKKISKGAVRCMKCNGKLSRQQKVSREELKDLIRNKPFTQIGKQFGVTDNAIRKWCKTFDLPYKSADIKKYTNEEWQTV